MFHSIMLKIKTCELNFGGWESGGGCLCCTIMVVQECTKFKFKNSKEMYFLNDCAILSDV